jgi:hypothetical protein
MADLKPLKRCRNIDVRAELEKFHLCSEDFELEGLVDTVFTQLQHPVTNATITQGFGCVYKAPGENTNSIGIVRDILCYANNPKKVSLLIQDACTAKHLKRKGYDPEALALRSDNEVVVTSTYRFIDLDRVKENCLILTNEQFKYFVPDEEQTYGVFFFR